MRTWKSCEIAILHLITWFWWTSSSVLFWEWFNMPRQLSTPAPPQCIPVLEGLGLSLWLWSKRTAGTLCFPMDTPQQGSASGFPIFFHKAVPLEYSCEYTLCLRGWFTIVQRHRTIRSGAVLVVCLMSCIHFTWLDSTSIAKHKSKSNTWHSSFWNYQSFFWKWEPLKMCGFPTAPAVKF